MRSLPELQRAFARAVFDDAADLHPEVAEEAEKRIGVYRRAVFANLRSALEGIYPVVLRLVGAEFFSAASDSFVRTYHSLSGDLHRFGKEFPGFMGCFSSAGSLPYLPDVARLEWAVHEAFHAADAGPFPLAELAGMPPSDYQSLRLTLHPACRIVRSPYPVHRIWQVNQPERTGDETVSLDEGEVTVLVTRSAFEVVLWPLQDAERTLVDAVAGGATLAEAFEAICKAGSEADASAILHRGIENNAITGFSRETVAVQRLGDFPS